MQPQSEEEMLTNPQSDTPRKINDSDLLSSVISKMSFDTFLRHEQDSCKGNYWMLLIPGTGNGERGTGNGERGTGNRERESGN